MFISPVPSSTFGVCYYFTILVDHCQAQSCQKNFGIRDVYLLSVILRNGIEYKNIWYPSRTKLRFDWIFCKCSKDQLWKKHTICVWVLSPTSPLYGFPDFSFQIMKNFENTFSQWWLPWAGLRFQLCHMACWVIRAVLWAWWSNKIQPVYWELAKKRNSLNYTDSLPVKTANNFPKAAFCLQTARSLDWRAWRNASSTSGLSD